MKYYNDSFMKNYERMVKNLGNPRRLHFNFTQTFTNEKYIDNIYIEEFSFEWYGDFEINDVTDHIKQFIKSKLDVYDF